MNAPFANVLISSVSKKVPLIKSVRKALDKMQCKGQIIGGDVNKHCIGRYFVDQFWEMPKLDELTPEDFAFYCHERKVKYIIPTRDGELDFYAQNKAFFSGQGLHLMVSKPESLEICCDKLLFYQTMSRFGYSSVKTTLTLDELDCERCVVKEQFGAGSRNIGLALTKSEASKYADKLVNPIFQPYIMGDEVSVDLYIERSGIAKGVILRRREIVVDGESQMTTSFKDDTLEEMCCRMAEEIGLYGHVMFQLIKKDNVYYVLESNARFGGASTLSLEMGLDSFYWFFLEESGENLSKYPFVRAEGDKSLIRYPEDLIQTCLINV